MATGAPFNLSLDYHDAEINLNSMLAFGLRCVFPFFDAECRQVFDFAERVYWDGTLEFAAQSWDQTSRGNDFREGKFWDYTANSRVRYNGDVPLQDSPGICAGAMTLYASSSSNARGYIQIGNGSSSTLHAGLFHDNAERYNAQSHASFSATATSSHANTACVGIARCRVTDRYVYHNGVLEDSGSPNATTFTATQVLIGGSPTLDQAEICWLAIWDFWFGTNEPSLLWSYLDMKGTLFQSKVETRAIQWQSSVTATSPISSMLASISGKALRTRINGPKMKNKA